VRIARHLVALGSVSRAAARAYGGGGVRAARIAWGVHRRQGFEYAEALRVGALDPALSEGARARFVSRHASLDAQAPLNGGNEVPAITGDKAVFYRYCGALGIPVPELLGILDTRGSGWGAPGRVLAGPADLAAWVAEDLPDEFVVKPSEGYAGKGVRLVGRAAGGALLVNGRRQTAAALWDELRRDPEFPVWIVQERLVNHPDLARMGGPQSLHGVRIATIVGRDGEPRVLFAMLKLALSGGASDNFLGGSTGNAIVEVDPATGRLGPLTLPRDGPAGFRGLADNPLTGEPVEGRTLPYWQAACALVLDAAPHFLPARALGWDVALTPRGPVILETNIRWLPLPFPSMRSVLDQLIAEGAPQARA